MNIWKILQIDRTDDEKLIKTAYHTRLRQVNPEDDPEGFMELRSAYEDALSYAKSVKQYAEDEEDYDEYEDDEYDEYEDFEDDEYWEPVELSEEQKRLNEWKLRVDEVYENYTKRINADEWNKLLYEDIPIKLKYYNLCREAVKWRFIEGGSTFVPDDVRKLFDKFFSFAGTEFERAQNNYVEKSRRYNKKIKLNENIEFNKLMNTDGVRVAQIDGFYSAYESFVDSIHLWESDKKLNNKLTKIQRIYAEMNCVYLPYECLFAALQLKSGHENKAKEKLDELKEKYKDAVEVQLLEAQCCLYHKDYENAKELLKSVYRDIPKKSYPFAYQMAVCCKMAGMYYESYEFIKYLTYLRPEQVLFDMADEVCALFEKELTENMSDEERIAMCRIYLRSDRKKEAADILKTVSSKDGWDYNMAKCLCDFNEEEVPDKIESYEALEAYPKEVLNTFQKLEWEELQARYLYEKKAYIESIEKCNEILQDYPTAYSIVLLRSYVDYTYGIVSDPESGSNRDYFDMDYLISINKNRTESWLLAASIMHVMAMTTDSVAWLKDALREIEPVKDVRPQEYEYCRLMVLGSYDDEYKEAMEGFKRFWTFVKDNPVKTPAVSKYCLLDLRGMYVEAAKLLSHFKMEEDEEARKYYELLLSLRDSKYNHPEKYMDLLPLYYAAKQYDKAEPLAYERLDNCNEDYKIVEIVKKLLNLYRSTKEVDKATEVYNRFRRESDKMDYAKELGIVYYDAEEYERAIEIYEYARSHRTLNTIGYALLGDCYENCENYEMAEKIREEGTLYCSKCGDYWTTYNIYYDNYLMFKNRKDWEKALYYLELTERYSQMDNLNVTKQMGEIYRELMAPFVQERNIEKVEMLYKKAPKKVRPYTGVSIGNVYNNYLADDEENEDSGDETLIKEYKRKAIDYYMEDIENGNAYMASYGQASYWLETMGDDEGARQLLERGTKGCIEKELCADYWGRKNLFYKLAMLYQKLGNMEKMAENLELMLQHSELKNKESDYNGNACYAYFKLENYDKAYELYNNWYWTDTPHACLAMSAFGMGEYKKAVEHYRNSMEAKENKEIALLIRIAHCEYMENGNKCKDVFENLRDEILSYKGREGYSDGIFFYILADLALILGDKKQAQEYVAQAEAYSWEDEDDKISDEKYYNIWKLMYEKDYEGTYKYIESTGYHNEDSEVQALWSYLKNKLGKL